MYNGKFNTASRRNAGVVVSGNSVYVTESAFKTYANYKNFWIYSNDSDSSNEGTSQTTNSYVRYVATESSPLRVRNAPDGDVVGSIDKGTKVTVYETSGNWSRIDTNKWVSSSYLSSVQVSGQVASSVQVSVQNTVKSSVKYTTGTYVTTSNVNVRTGAGTKYAKKTYKQLSANARQQNRRLGGEFNGYRKGVTFKVTKVSGNWGRTVSGWVCLSYCRK